MNARTIALGLAGAVTTFLVVAALTIQLLSGPYGESPGVGILGVFAGAVGALLAGIAIAAVAGRVSRRVLVGFVAYGTLGVAFLGVALLRYVNVPGADELFTFPVHIGVSVLLAVVAASLAGRGGPRDATVGV
jgi:hypothetical protein